MVIAALVVAAVAVGAATAAIWVNMRTQRQMDHLRQQVAEALDAEQIMRRARKPGRGGLAVITGGAVALAREHKTATAALIALLGLSGALLALNWPEATEDVPVAEEATEPELRTGQSSTTTTTAIPEPEFQSEPVVALDASGERATVRGGGGGRVRQSPPLSSSAGSAEPADTPAPAPSTTVPSSDQPPVTSPPTTSTPPTTSVPPTPPTTTPPPAAQPDPEPACRLVQLSLLQVVEVCV